MRKVSGHGNHGNLTDTTRQRTSTSIGHGDKGHGSSFSHLLKEGLNVSRRSSHLKGRERSDSVMSSRGGQHKQPSVEEIHVRKRIPSPSEYLEPGSPVRVYITYLDTPTVKFVDGVTDGRGKPILPETRRHIMHGLVYDKQSHSFHPPRPSTPRVNGQNKLKQATGVLSIVQNLTEIPEKSPPSSTNSVVQSPDGLNKKYTMNKFFAGSQQKVVPNRKQSVSGPGNIPRCRSDSVSSVTSVQKGGINMKTAVRKQSIVSKAFQG